MADTKITALAAITTVDPAADVLPIVDVSDTSMAASGTTKKITSNQILGAGGTATLASATITGDLTVDTSTLKVDSANNRVGIGTATPSDLVHALGGNILLESTAGTFPQFISKVGAKTWSSGYRSGTTSFEVWEDSSQRYTIGNGGTPHTWYVGASTAMTLNSTGLGVGTSPSAKLDVYQATLGTAYFRGGYSARQLTLTATSDGVNDGAVHTFSIGSSAGQFLFANSGGTRLTIDSSGNVGVGVTPSASWFTGAKVIQFGGTGAIWNNGSNNTSVSSNAIVGNSGSTYIFNTAASYYSQTTGAHIFYTAPSGTAGNAITWTQAMTLDASGNLLVAKTSNTLSAIGCVLQANGVIVSTLAGSTNSTDTLDVYSNGAAAYRFYVGMGGTVYATNTTISAISDARLKENVQDIDAGLGAILALKPRKFDWKAGKGKDIKGDRGFIAQEFEQVFPDLIDTWKDPAPEGEAPYKSVRQDLIPVLVKAIQELTARVEALEA
jgi:hypothetical protein